MSERTTNGSAMTSPCSRATTTSGEHARGNWVLKGRETSIRYINGAWIQITSDLRQTRTCKLCGWTEER